MLSTVTYREMIAEDHTTLHNIWKNTPGLTLRKADSLEGFTAFLKRNPGFSFVAENQGQVIGGVLGGHDGRFGSIHHLVVLPAFRNQGVGQKLVSLSLQKIEASGMEKCHIFINKDNPVGIEFWKNHGWIERNELTMASYVFDVD